MTSEAINKKRFTEITNRKRKSTRINTKKENRDILIIVLALYLIGLVFILSASSASLVVNNQDPFTFVKKQILLGVVSLIPFSFAYFINIKKIVDKHKLVFFASIGILILVTLIGVEVNGNRSWLGIGSFRIQPAEFVKISLIICSAVYLKENYISIENFKKVSLVYVFLIGLVVLQKDLGTAIIMCGIAIFLLFIGGLSLKILSLICLGGAGALAAAIVFAPYRMQRLLIFTNPFQDYYGYGYQIIQSLYAIANGGFFGRGLYESVQKYGFLPENHTDFIFSIVVEEIGLIGAIVLLSLFVLLITKIFKIAYNLKRKEYTLIVAGIGCLIAIETLMNLAVAVSLLPVAGVTLPFVSYGGSSLMAKLTAIAIVLNINKSCEKANESDIVEASKEDALYRKTQLKRAKQNIKNTKSNIRASIKNFKDSLFKHKLKKDKQKPIVIKKTSKKIKSINLESSNTDVNVKQLPEITSIQLNDETLSQNNSDIIELEDIQTDRRIDKEKTSKFEITNVKLDVQKIIDNATTTKTKVVSIDNNSGFKEIKIKKRNSIFSSKKDSSN